MTPSTGTGRRGRRRAKALVPQRLSTVCALAVVLAVGPSIGGVAPAHAAGLEPVSATSFVPGPGCVPVDPSTADTATAAGWLGYLAAHRRDIGLLLNDGRGTVLRHQSMTPFPAASAAKVLHLAAYADAVDRGRLDPETVVPVADWEAWYLPGLDGGAHVQALTALGIPVANGAAVDPSSTVTVDDIARVMIRYSDNAAADYLRDVLGDGALRRAAASVGWFGPALPSYLGSVITLLRPETARGHHRTDRELRLAQRYARDPSFRAEVRSLPVPGLPVQMRWAEHTAAAPPAALAALQRKLARQGGNPERPGSLLARQHLEWPPAPPDALGLGAKGGSYPGIITEAMILRRKDGTTASAVLMVRRMPVTDWVSGLSSFAHQELLLAALEDRSVLERVGCSIGATVAPC